LTPQAPSFKDYLKSYTALKNKLFNAQNLEEGKDALRELINDYAELLEMDKYNIQMGLYQECQEREITLFRQGDRNNQDYLLPAFLWLHLVLHTDCQYVRFNFYNDSIKCNYHGKNEYPIIQLKFDDMAHFVKPKVLVIDNDCRTLTFDTMVCITSSPKNGNCYWWFKRTGDIATLKAVKTPNSQEYYDNDGWYDYYLPDHYCLSGAVKIKNTYGNALLSYLELDL
ncbi:hypothetical protein, partial [Helicobacter ailurogastricus]|uniref:hypothetical protein n=1 Tax=Helicobacter ailurogastricus TaxID=1578720 RepID=UPI0013153BD0